MQDYIVFGHGYDGEVRQFDNDLEFVRVVSKPVMMKAGDAIPPGANLQFFNLPVSVIQCDQHYYNVASDRQVSEDELRLAIMQENPLPVPR
ncbi:hypothetical protein [Enterobacter sp. KB-280D8]|uniref:hypothetical protein n=1 Tax=Enterobacter sp. KB-280D8 TaxID=3242495 RepID=UPI003528023C